MKEKIKKISKIIFVSAIVLTIAMYWYDQYTYYFVNNYTGGPAQCQEDDNVAIINIHGEIFTYTLSSPLSIESDQEPADAVSSEDIIAQIDAAKQNNSIKAIIVEIDSYGGSAVAAEEIMNALKSATKPVVAVIRNAGDSAAYLAASGADIIFASEMSEVGSIGVTMSYLDYSQNNLKEGIIYQQLSSGKFKDAGSQDKYLTAEEREIFMRDIKIIHENFVKYVAENRGLDIEKVEKLADGSTMLGKAAKENGLIDEIGSMYEAELWIKNNLGIEPQICVY